MNWKGSPTFGRRETLTATLDLLEQRRTEKQTIVEIGSSEAYSPDGIGNAILAFAWYAEHIETQVATVDIRPNATVNCMQIVAGMCPSALSAITAYNLDAFEFAETARAELDSIDLIYYDGPSEPANWYVDLHVKLESLFKAGSLALFDDTAHIPDYNGKGAALVPYLLRNGWATVDVAHVPVFPMVLLEKL